MSGLIFCACSSPERSVEPLHVAAAASLSAPMQALADTFQQQHPGVKVRFHFAASSFLAKQIEQHVPAEVFVSASPVWTQYLAVRGLVDSSKVVTIARNQLVVITAAGVATFPAQLADLKHAAFHPLAVGDLSHVPVGIYARQVLQAAGIWPEVEPHILPTLDAAATLATVARGEAPVGIAYRNEIFQREDVRLAFAVPDSLQPDIRYTAVIILSQSLHPHAQKFLQFFSTPTGQKILQEHQLLPPSDDAN